MLTQYVSRCANCELQQQIDISTKWLTLNMYRAEIWHLRSEDVSHSEKIL